MTLAPLKVTGGSMLLDVGTGNRTLALSGLPHELLRATNCVVNKLNFARAYQEFILFPEMSQCQADLASLLNPIGHTHMQMKSLKAFGMVLRKDPHHCGFESARPVSTINFFLNYKCILH